MSNIQPKCCAICQKLPTDLKRLPCMHFFCEDCLRRYLINGGYDKFGYFPCPVCKYGISVPLGGLHNLFTLSMKPKQQITKNLHRVEASAPSFMALMPKQTKEPPSLINPTGLTCTSENNIIICDRKNSNIFTYNLEGKLISCFSCKEKVFACLYTKFHSIFVSNGENHTPLVLEFNLRGQRIVSRPMMNKMEATHGICLLDNPRQIVVSSVETSSLYIVGDTGKLVSRINGKGLLGHPYYIASTPTNEIIISDHLNHCLKVICRNGKLKTTISSVGTSERNLYEPMGMIVEGNNIIIADSGNRSVKSFKTNGKFNCVLFQSHSPEKPIAVALTTDQIYLVVLLVGGASPRFVVRSYEDLKSIGPVSCV